MAEITTITTSVNKSFYLNNRSFCIVSFFSYAPYTHLLTLTSFSANR